MQITTKIFGLCFLIRERDLLEQTSTKKIRASHSTESILRDSSPPPKPPLPNRYSFQIFNNKTF